MVFVWRTDGRRFEVMTHSHDLKAVESLDLRPSRVTTNGRYERGSVLAVTGTEVHSLHAVPKSAHQHICGMALNNSQGEPLPAAAAAEQAHSDDPLDLVQRLPVLRATPRNTAPWDKTDVAVSESIGKLAGIPKCEAERCCFDDDLLRNAYAEDVHENKTLAKLWTDMRACRELQEVTWQGYSTEKSMVEPAKGWLLKEIPLGDKVVNLFVSSSQVRLGYDIEDD